MAWEKSNDTFFRVLEDSAGGDIGCGGTQGAIEDNIKSNNFARYKKYNRLGSLIWMHRLVADGDVES